jgi:hypothetical protein
MRCNKCGGNHDEPSSKWSLSTKVCAWRAERPDEWTMDELLRGATELQAENAELKRLVEELKTELTENADSCGNSSLVLGWCKMCTSIRWCKSGQRLLEDAKGAEE